MSADTVTICGATFAAAELPRAIVFDVDFTLWPFWVDTHRGPPFRRTKEGGVADGRGKCCALYPDVPEILLALRGLPKGVRPVTAFASRTSAPEWLEALAKLTDLGDGGAACTMWRAPDHREIYPGSKIKHFRAIAAASGVAPHDMLFFDDEASSNRDVLSLGVKFVEVCDGLDVPLLHAGLRWYAGRHASREGAMLEG